MSKEYLAQVEVISYSETKTDHTCKRCSGNNLLLFWSVVLVDQQTTSANVNENTFQAMFTSG